MKREELIRALRRLVPETGSLCCLGCGYAHSCSTHGCAVIREAIEEIEALRKPIRLSDRVHGAPGGGGRA